MFIQIEETPNPLALKFLPGQVVMQEGTIYVADKSEVGKSPLAAQLFAVEGVDGVFFGSDFITITKTEEAKWDVLKPQLLPVMMDYLVSGRAIAADEKKAEANAQNNEIKEDDDELVKQIKELLNTRVRPAVAMDGGDIIFHGFKEGIVYLEMHGACSGCPSSTATLKDGIENMFKHYIPEVQSVEAIAA